MDTVHSRQEQRRRSRRASLIQARFRAFPWRYVVLVLATVVAWAYASLVLWARPLAMAGWVTYPLSSLLNDHLTLIVTRWMAVVVAGALTGIAVARHTALKWAFAATGVTIALLIWSNAVRPELGARAVFAANRSQLAAVAELGREGKLTSRNPYGVRLTFPLRHLSANGHAAYADERVFVPQWVGIPDEAGGFIYSPQGAPRGFDMFGLSCVDPASLGSGWWACGVEL